MFVETEKGSFKGDYMSFSERAMVGTSKQTYTILYMINCLCLLPGEIFIFFCRGSVMPSQLPELYQDGAVCFI